MATIDTQLGELIDKVGGLLPLPAVTAMATLDTLPSELIEKIGTFLPLPAFTALRSTCRSIENKLSYSFSRRFSGTKSIHLIRSDLERLVELSKSRFSARVHTLVIEFEENDIIRVIGQNKKLHEGWYSISDECEENIYLRAEVVERYNAFVTEKKESTASGAHLDLLVQALGNLKSLKKINLTDRSQAYFHQEFYKYANTYVKILCLGSLDWGWQESDQEEKDRIGSDQEEEDKTIGSDVNITGKFAKDGPFCVLVRALTQAKCQLEALVLDFDMLSMDKSYPNSDTHEQIALVMESLSELSLLNVGCFDIFTNLVHLAWDVQKLKITRIFPEDVLGYAANYLALSTLDLMNTGIRDGDLNYLILSQRKTLTTLKLFGLGSCSWITLFEDLSADSTLQAVYASNLYTMDRSDDDPAEAPIFSSPLFQDWDRVEREMERRPFSEQQGDQLASLLEARGIKLLPYEDQN